MRGQVRLTWVKIHISGWLHGSIRWQLEPAERGVWADLIVLAGQCLQGGRICDNDGRVFPLDFLADQLHIPLELLETTISKCQKEGRIEVNEGVITITNWKAYQSEYERQKPYRQSMRGGNPWKAYQYRQQKATGPDKYQGQKYEHMVKK